MNNSIAIALAVARKDLTSEWRTRELVPALGQLIVLALVIANFGFQIDARNAPSIAPGVLWLTLVFAGLVAFGRAFAAEREQSSLEAVLMTPASLVAIFAGKAIAATLLLVACEAVLLPALGLGVRRLHDIGKSGWWLLVALVPILGAIYLIYLYCQPSTTPYGAAA